MYKKLYDVVIVLTKGQICGQNPTTFTSKIVCIHKDDAFDQKKKMFFSACFCLLYSFKTGYLCITKKERKLKMRTRCNSFTDLYSFFLASLAVQYLIDRLVFDFSRLGMSETRTKVKEKVKCLMS